MFCILIFSSSLLVIKKRYQTLWCKVNVEVSGFHVTRSYCCYIIYKIFLIIFCWLQFDMYPISVRHGPISVYVCWSHHSLNKSFFGELIWDFTYILYSIKVDAPHPHGSTLPYTHQASDSEGSASVSHIDATWSNKCLYPFESSFSPQMLFWRINMKIHVYLYMIDKPNKVTY